MHNWLGIQAGIHRLPPVEPVKYQMQAAPSSPEPRRGALLLLGAALLLLVVFSHFKAYKSGREAMWTEFMGDFSQMHAIYVNENIVALPAIREGSMIRAPNECGWCHYTRMRY